MHAVAVSYGQCVKVTSGTMGDGEVNVLRFADVASCVASGPQVLVAQLLKIGR